MAQAARVEIPSNSPLPRFNEAIDPKKCRRPHFIDDCQKFSIYQISWLKKENNEAAEPATSRSTGPYTDSTARGQKESAEDVEQRHRN